MALPSSGPLSISEIRNEEVNNGGFSSTYSLRQLSANAGKSTPDAISEFYGYAAASCSISGTNVINTSNSSASGVVSITGSKSVRFSTFGGSGSGCFFNSQLTINGTTYTQNASAFQTLTTDIPLTSGTYGYSLTRTGFNCTSGNNASINCL